MATSNVKATNAIDTIKLVNRKIRLNSGALEKITFANTRTVRTESGTRILVKNVEAVGRSLRELSSAPVVAKKSTTGKTAMTAKTTAKKAPVVKKAPVAPKTPVITKAQKVEQVTIAFKEAAVAMRTQHRQATSLLNKQARLTKQQMELSVAAKQLVAKETALFEAMEAITEAHKANKTITVAMFRKLKITVAMFRKLKKATLA